MLLRLLEWLIGTLPLSEKLRADYVPIEKYNKVKYELSRVNLYRQGLELEWEAARSARGALLNRLNGILLERGRRVYGYMKQAQPQLVTIQRFDYAPSATVVQDPAPGGKLIKAYVVDNINDLKCLNMAMGYKTDDEDSPAFDDACDRVVYKGHLVVAACMTLEGKDKC